MTVNYKGSDKEYNYRVAEISFDENEEKKERAFDIIRGSMEYNHITDKELKEDINNQDEETLTAFIAEYDE